ncbi:etoposide-induced protein 2.4 homolog isoform X2 [Pomacea canaliculata]|uniref:etoposide-induced protein 2.4 homolog isoform X2 n=2 Tax=Pomacea canaliculata TaxID=400727 RepID=UPI000D72F261|nr:etoposide-induced protein 2.4 homolog isoform X2 [Pomacea canaliculata]
MSLLDVLQRMFGSVALGIRDVFVGAVKAYKMEGEIIHVTPAKKTPERISELARRRAERDRHKEPKETSSISKMGIRYRILRSWLWNGGVCLLSLLLFYNLLLPCLAWMFDAASSDDDHIWNQLVFVLGFVFQSCWVMPLLSLSRLVNLLWFQDIADAAYIKLRGKPQLPSFSLIIADLAFGFILQMFFSIQTTLFSIVPVARLGEIIALFHMGVQYGLYAFEYKWFNMGIEPHVRVHVVENNWPYYLGFGLPLALLTSCFTSYGVRYFVSALLYPVLIVSANETEEPKQPFIFSLKIYGPAIYLSNGLLRTMSKVRSFFKTRSDREISVVSD